MFNTAGTEEKTNADLSEGDVAARLFSGNINQEPPSSDQAQAAAVLKQDEKGTSSDEQAHIVAVKKIHRHISDPVRPGERYLHSLEESTPTPNNPAPMPSFGLPPQSGPLLGGFSTFPLGSDCGSRRRVSVPELRELGVAAPAQLRRSASFSGEGEPDI